MSVTLKLKRGTEAAIDSATLSEGEIAYSLDTKKLVVFDGQTGQKYLNSTDVALASHCHDESDITDLGPYAATDHNHDSTYSTIGHTHSYATMVAASFTQATSSPATLLDPPNNAVITKIVVVVDSAASAGSPIVSVGIASDTDRDMDELDNDLTIAATYIVEPYTACGTDGDNIILTITPDSQTFSGRCYLHYAVPV